MHIFGAICTVVFKGRYVYTTLSVECIVTNGGYVYSLSVECLLQMGEICLHSLSVECIVTNGEICLHYFECYLHILMEVAFATESNSKRLELNWLCYSCYAVPFMYTTCTCGTRVCIDVCCTYCTCGENYKEWCLIL